MAGLFTLPLDLWAETMRWNREQLERQGRWFEEVTRPAPPPTWCTPNEVVFEAPSLRLRAFSRPEEMGPGEAPAPGSAHEIPVLIITPQVNHSSICDYTPEQSLVRTIQQHGFAKVYATEWKSADLARSDETLDDIMEVVERCIDHIGGRAHLVGLCQGGWMSMLHASLVPEQVQSLVLAAAPIDFHGDKGGIYWLAMTTPMFVYRMLVELGGGVMRGEYIKGGFNNLRFLERYAGNYLLLWSKIDDPAFLKRFRRLYEWYNAPQHIPGAAYLRIVQALFKENRMVKGTLECRGQMVDLSQVEVPLYMIAGERDHITPAGQLFAAPKYTSSKIAHEYVADAGHIGVFMGSKPLRNVWPVLLDDLYREFEVPASDAAVPADATDVTV